MTRPTELKIDLGDRREEAERFKADNLDMLLSDFVRTYDELRSLKLVCKQIHEVWRLQGHENEVNYVSFSQDGRLLASGSWDKTVRLWNPDMGQEFRRLLGHSSYVW